MIITIFSISVYSSSYGGSPSWEMKDNRRAIRGYFRVFGRRGEGVVMGVNKTRLQKAERVNRLLQWKNQIILLLMGGEPGPAGDRGKGVWGYKKGGTRYQYETFSFSGEIVIDESYIGLRIMGKDGRSAAEKVSVFKTIFPKIILPQLFAKSVWYAVRL